MCFEGLCIFSNSVCSLLFLFEILDPAWHFWTLLGLCWVLPIWKLRFGSLHSYTGKYYIKRISHFSIRNFFPWTDRPTNLLIETPLPEFKNYPFHVQGVYRPVDEVAPRCPCKHADGTVHASTKSQPSSPHPPWAEIWTAKVLSAGMREGTAQSLASNTLKSSYKYRPHGLLTHS